MNVTEVGPEVWRIESLLGPRSLFQYVVASGQDVLLVDTGTSSTPREAIVPALRRLGITSDAVRLVLVTHPDLDHQGGLAGLKDVFPKALAACGFADRGLVVEPERLITDRYGAWEREHGLGYSDEEKEWMRSAYGAATEIDITFSGGETLSLGDRKLQILHAPGHSAGHVILFEPASRLLLSSDAVHGRMCPAVDGTPSLPPTYVEVDPYLETIALIESLQPVTIHSGHWPAQSGSEAARFLADSREFVLALDAVLEERLETPVTLRGLCEHVDGRLGPFGADPINLMFAVSGHLRRLVQCRCVKVVDPLERPPRFRREPCGSTPPLVSP